MKLAYGHSFFYFCYYYKIIPEKKTECTPNQKFSVLNFDNDNHDQVFLQFGG